MTALEFFKSAEEKKSKKSFLRRHGPKMALRGGALLALAAMRGGAGRAYREAGVKGAVRATRFGGRQMASDFMKGVRGAPEAFASDSGRKIVTTVLGL